MGGGTGRGGIASFLFVFCLASPFPFPSCVRFKVVFPGGLGVAHDTRAGTKGSFFPGWACVAAAREMGRRAGCVVCVPPRSGCALSLPFLLYFGFLSFVAPPTQTPMACIPSSISRNLLLASGSMQSGAVGRVPAGREFISGGWSTGDDGGVGVRTRVQAWVDFAVGASLDSCFVSLGCFGPGLVMRSHGWVTISIGGLPRCAPLGRSRHGPGPDSRNLGKPGQCFFDRLCAFLVVWRFLDLVSGESAKRFQAFSPTVQVRLRAATVLPSEPPRAPDRRPRHPQDFPNSPLAPATVFAPPF